MYLGEGMNQLVLCATSSAQKILKQVKQQLEGYQNIPIIFDFNSIFISVDEDGDATWDDIFDALRIFKNTHQYKKTDICIVIMEEDNEWNWFSAWPPNNGEYKNKYGEEEYYNLLGFVHSGDWEDYVPAPTEVCVAYDALRLYLEIHFTKFVYEQKNSFFDEKEGKIKSKPFSKYLLRRVSNNILSHDDARGCIHDQCDDGEDIIHQFKSTKLCIECSSILDESGFSETVYSEIFSFFRKIRSQYLNIFDEDIKTVVQLQNHPAPLAFIKESLEKSRLKKNRHITHIWRAIPYFEFMLRYTYILLCSTEEIEFLSENHPSLGRRVSFIQELGGNRSPLRVEIKKQIFSCLQLINNVRVADRRLTLVQYRNGNIGHGAMLGEDQQRKDEAETILTVVDSIEEVLFPIWKPWSLFEVKQRSIEKDRVVLKAKKLEGNYHDSSSLKEEVSFQRNSLDSRANFLFSDETVLPRIVAISGESIVDLHASIRFQNCLTCGQKRLTMRDGIFWTDVERGHRI